MRAVTGSGTPQSILTKRPFRSWEYGAGRKCISPKRLGHARRRLRVVGDAWALRLLCGGADHTGGGAMEPTNKQKHEAGRYLAVGEALIRGYKAAVDGPTTYIDVNGHRVLVQVATKGTWQIADIDKYTSATVEHVVLVDITNGQREFYICPGDALRSEVRQRLNELLSRNNGIRPRNPDSKHAGIRPADVQEWHNDWARLAPR